MTCPSDLELARARTLAAGGSIDAESAAHLAGCTACRAGWDAMTAAIDLARELPVAMPPAARREEVRTALLAASAAMTSPATRRAWIAPAFAGAVAAGLLIYFAAPRAAPQARRAHGVVHPRPGARYAASSLGADEIVRLSDGVIDVEVEPLPAGERFLVVVGGAEIEVHGTAFSVTASAQHLVDVAVSHGRVDVRPEAGAPATLAAGQSGHAAGSPPIAVASPSPPVTVAPGAIAPQVPARSTTRTADPPAPRGSEHRVFRPRAARPSPLSELAPSTPPASIAGGPASTPSGGSSEEAAYNQAWEALRANDFARAASGFSRVMLLAPDSALIEDASFWRAVALARGERRGNARAAFEDFLDSYAGSVRAGEASAMLGWILIDAGDYDEAGRRFHAAIGDASAAVRQSARAGLDALAKSRAPAPRR